MKTIKIKVNSKELVVESGTSLEDISKSLFGESYREKLAAKIHNAVYHLDHVPEEDCFVEFLDISSVDGFRVYTKTVAAVFIAACKNLYPERNVRIDYSLGSGLYSTFDDGSAITFKILKDIEIEMRRIVSESIPIRRSTVGIEVALNLFEKFGYHDKISLFKSLNRETADIYSIGEHIDTFHGYLAPSTDYARLFELKYYYPGVLIRMPSQASPFVIPEFRELKKLSKVFKETSDWANIMELSDLGSLNQKILNGEYQDVIRISEALHEKKIAYIADRVCEDEEIHLVLIAGPSSSGKTTFASRLQTQLKVNGKRPVAISVDDYFVNREDTPKGPDGSPDFESIGAIDLPKLNSDLIALIEGDHVEIPIFNFITGRREAEGKKLCVEKNQPIIVEGIHALNPAMTAFIPEKNKYKIYISALTQLNLDGHNRIATTDARLLRRMVRDEKYRGNSAIRTFEMWKNVRAGEERNIFPYQEEADIMFDSALVYELSVLKKYALPLLRTIDEESEFFSEAKKTLRFLEYFVDIKEEGSIPVHSILREFIGGIHE